MLRLKVQIGDAEPQVIGECFGALLAIAAEYSLPFVAAYLHGKDEELQEYAALALGESRRPEALQLLRDAWADIVTTEGARRPDPRGRAASQRSRPSSGCSKSSQPARRRWPPWPWKRCRSMNAIPSCIEQVNAAKARRDTPL